jgi:hypothetical protein
MLGRMSDMTLNWLMVDETAAALEASESARLKWRQRGVPAEWKIKITQALMARGVPVALNDFERLPKNPGRIAA